MDVPYCPQASYCSGVRPGVKHGLEPSLHLLYEVAEASNIFLSQHNVSILNKHCSSLESLHISDQYTGLLQDRSGHPLHPLTLPMIPPPSPPRPHTHSEDSEVVVVRKAQKRIQLTYRCEGACCVMVNIGLLCVSVQ